MNQGINVYPVPSEYVQNATDSKSKSRKRKLSTAAKLESSKRPPPQPGDADTKIPPKPEEEYGDHIYGESEEVAIQSAFLEPVTSDAGLMAGGDLHAELEDVFSRDFNFTGTYYHASSSTDAPNPCLHIKDIGNIGLPLSERDAELIKNVSERAPYGHGTKTVINKDVRDTWELSARDVTFRNLAWVEWLETSVVPTISVSLGVPSGTKTACHPYKLLLYETGSHFLAHQDTQKEDGMFASVVILLPSEFTGGQVHLSHSDKKEILDFSHESLTHTSITAWYTDVVHEIQPVFSGFRLALTFNLVASETTVFPCLPDANPGVRRFRQIMRKWNNGLYERFGEADAIDNGQMGYLLEHQYSNLDLQKGLAALKGCDSYLVRNISVVASNEQIMLCLAKIVFAIHEGEGEGRYYLEEIHDLDGDKVQDQLNITISDVIQQKPFAGKEPDETRYGSYMGNEEGTVDHFYRRSILFLVTESRASDIFTGDNILYPLIRLKHASDPPTPRDMEWVDLIIPGLCQNPQAVLTMLRYAIKWRNPDLWDLIMRNGDVDIGKDSELLLDGLQTFNFSCVQSGFQLQLDKSRDISSRLTFARTLQQHANDRNFSGLHDWCVEQILRILDSLQCITPKDIPVLVPLCLSQGVHFIRAIILPQIKSATDPCSVFTTLARELHSIRSSPLSSGALKTAIEAAIEEALASSVPLWKALPPPLSELRIYYRGFIEEEVEAEVGNVMSIVETCLFTGHLSPCAPLFALLLDSEGSAEDRFNNHFQRILPRLKVAIEKASIKLTAPPFQDIFRSLIIWYIRDILLPKKPTGPPNAISALSCTCADCTLVNEFLVSSDNEFFISPTQRRFDFEEMVGSVVEIGIVGRPWEYRLKLTKREEKKAWTIWEARKADAREFIEGIGDATTLKGILGDDVLKQMLERVGLENLVYM